MRNVRRIVLLGASAVALLVGSSATRPLPATASCVSPPDCPCQWSGTDDLAVVGTVERIDTDQSSNYFSLRIEGPDRQRRLAVGDRVGGWSSNQLPCQSVEFVPAVGDRVFAFVAPASQSSWYACDAYWECAQMQCGASPPVDRLIPEAVPACHEECREASLLTCEVGEPVGLLEATLVMAPWVDEQAHFGTDGDVLVDLDAADLDVLLGESYEACIERWPSNAPRPCNDTHVINAFPCSTVGLASPSSSLPGAGCLLALILLLGWRTRR